MRNAEQKMNYVFGEREDDGLREEYVQELSSALHNYMHTGVKSSQLDELIELKDKFHRKYQERFMVADIIKAIETTSREKMRENICGLESLQNANAEVTRQMMPLCQETTIASMSEVLQSQLKKILVDASYLSHVNMLYELYAKEEKLRQEEKEFAELSSKYQKLSEISERLSEQRRMEFQDLQKQAGMSYEELAHMLEYCGEYFNIRETKDKVVVSLSPEGRKYRNYINCNKGAYSEQAVSQLIYKNCSNVVEGLRKSYNSGIKHEPLLDGLEQESQRAVRAKYFEALKDFLEPSEIYGDISDESEIMERNDGVYGKYKVRISEE